MQSVFELARSGSMYLQRLERRCTDKDGISFHHEKTKWFSFDNKMYWIIHFWSFKRIEYAYLCWFAAKEYVNLAITLASNMLTFNYSGASHTLTMMIVLFHGTLQKRRRVLLEFGIWIIIIKSESGRLIHVHVYIGLQGISNKII